MDKTTPAVLLLMIVANSVGVAEGAEKADPVKEIVDKLETKITTNEFQDNTPLKEALGMMAQRSKMDFGLKTDLFQAAANPGVENWPIRLPKLVNVRLATFSQLMASQVDGVCLMSKTGVLFVPRDDKVVKAMIAKGCRPLQLPLKGDAKLLAMLDKPVSLEKDMDPNKTSLKAALSFFAGRHELNLVIDRRAFIREKGAEDIESFSVSVPKFTNQRLGDVLQKLCQQAEGSYRIEDNVVVVVPAKAAKR